MSYRAERPVRRMGTEIIADRRTRRRRTRSTEKHEAIMAFVETDDEEYCDGTCRAGRYCVLHGDLV